MTAPQGSSICLGHDSITFVDHAISFPAKVVLALSPRLLIQIECSEIYGPILGYLWSHQLQGKSLPVMFATGEKMEVIPVDVPIGGDTARLVPTRGPITALQTGDAIQIASFSVLNFPDFVDMQSSGHWTTTSDGGSSERLDSVYLRASPWDIRVTSAPDRSGVKAALRSDGYAITHEGAVARSDGRTFSIADGAELFECLRNFLSFARGSRTGLATITGIGKAGGQVWERWGAAGVEGWRAVESWFHHQHGEMLPELFPGFWSTWHGTTVNDPVRMALEWYLIGNVQRNVHAAIILIQAALERLSFLGAGTKGTSFEGDWIAAALQSRGINDQIPRKFGRSGVWGKSRWDHGPHAFVSIRNDLVHSSMKMGTLSVDEYVQASQLGLWYVELMLLREFDYHGSYWNRLTREFEPVPWAAGATSP